MPWLWSDTLADLLDAVDRVAPERLAAMRDRPVAHRLGEGEDPLALAREVLSGMSEEADQGLDSAPLPA